MKKHNDESIRSSSNKTKTAWNILNSSANRRKEPLIDSIIHGDSTISDPKQIAEVFNNYFSNISDLYPASPRYEESLRMVTESLLCDTTTFSFCPITLDRLKATIDDLKPNNSDKYGDIPTFIFKDYFHIIGPSLLNLINGCIVNGIFPDFLKVGRITPIYKKKGSRLKVNNYRPITILPTISKIFEKVLYNQLSNFFESNNLLHDSQFGFRRNRSTIQAIQKLLDQVYLAIDNHDPVYSLHFDLAKAFDLIDHSLLLKKLKLYGLDDISIKLISSYLDNRQQIVKLDTANDPVFSNLLNVKTGVGQGSILGPLLFIIFINDLPFHVSAPSFLFADDTSSVNSGQNAFQNLVLTHNQICHWFDVNGLFCNTDKTQLISYFVSKEPEPQHLLPIDDSLQIPVETEVRLLGLDIDSQLNWNTHVNNVLKKLRKSNWAVRNLSKVVSLNTVLMFYHANILSHLRYGLIFWGRSPAANSAFIEQKRALRIIYNKPFNYSCKELFINEQLMTLPSLYIYDCIKFSVLNNLISSDDMNPSHNYNTRHAFIKNSTVKLEKSRHNVKFSSIQLFDALPLTIKEKFRGGEIPGFFRMLSDFLIKKAYYHVNEFLNEN